ncbi:MAG TPA: DUF4123 domain-containing protein [Dyella sp.]|uniref:DUF4123 domain-containing protein n=1 Tax=Dyella sp. TaxID=1869338 RepID=UPI002D14211F|nr:DUF4123 domain-containing protein [Dyella sp.]HTV87152.1 DUF4123 domain-containing protein [Dyella sp.]
MNRTYLFDGAILAEHAVDISVLDTSAAVYLYSDLDGDAARVGPILIPETTETLAFANRLINAEDSRRFATSLLFHRGTQESLVAHLSQLRYLATSHEAARRYFLRFADTRALYALSHVATPAQLHGLLGPVSRWTWVAPDKTFLELTVPLGWAGESSAPPLHFSPEQLRAFLRQCRYHELLQATLTANPSLSNLGSLAERHTWTQRAHQWLHQHGINHGGIHVAVNEAVWRTRGGALAAETFPEVVRRAASEGQPQVIREWATAAASKRSA